jgi:hypothetical protein
MLFIVVQQKLAAEVRICNHIDTNPIRPYSLASFCLSHLVASTAFGEYEHRPMSELRNVETSRTWIIVERGQTRTGRLSQSREAYVFKDGCTKCH